jgi:hypothetical protein
VLGLLATAGGFVVYAILIAEAGTSRATVITYVHRAVFARRPATAAARPARLRAA